MVVEYLILYLTLVIYSKTLIPLLRVTDIVVQQTPKNEILAVLKSKVNSNVLFRNGKYCIRIY